MDLEQEMLKVQRALGVVAAEVDRNPWEETHVNILARIAGLPTGDVKDLLMEFFQVIAIQNTKMVGVFTALSPFGPRVLDAEAEPLMDALARQEAYPLAFPVGLPRAEARARLADTVLSVASASYDDYLRQVKTTLVADIDAAAAALPGA